jgi:error-prone DNA polymerase
VGEGPRRRGATQLALPLDLPAPPKLAPLDRWAAMVADYATTSVTTGDHPLGLLRGELRGQGGVHSADLERLPHGTAVRIGGLVVARQRPATAKGVTFLLIEDEHGTVNLIVPLKVYERDRLVVRTEPLVVAAGRLERHASGGGAVNVLVQRLTSLSAPGRTAKVAELAPVREHGAETGDRTAPGVAAAAADELAATGTGDFRAVAPAAMSFAQGRRR